MADGTEVVTMEKAWRNLMRTMSTGWIFTYSRLRNDVWKIGQLMKTS